MMMMMMMMIFADVITKLEYFMVTEKGNKDSNHRQN